MVEPFLYNFGVDVVFHGEPFLPPFDPCGLHAYFGLEQATSHALSAMTG